MLLTADKYLFTDTNAITTYMFSMYYHGYALQELADLARSAERRYHLVFRCDTDIPYEDTWDRSGDMNRKGFEGEIRVDLEARGIRFKVLKGSLDERVEVVEAELRTFNRCSRIRRHLKTSSPHLSGPNHSGVSINSRNSMFTRAPQCSM